jgi:hypothetical protein
MRDMSGRVFLHVGSPKTGTTYLQDVLHKHRRDLRGAGVLYPGKGNRAHFLATLDLRGLKFAGFEDPDVPGSWERLTDEMRMWPGVSVLSHEILAGAEESEIVTAVSSFGDADVHVIITARDLARQIPSMWQESIKNQQTTPWPAYLDMLRATVGEDAPAGQQTPGHRFWRSQDAADIAARWGKQVGADHVHLVTVPNVAGRDGPEELWSRFSSVIGIDSTVFDGRMGKPNPALGVAETELLRRLNERVADTMVWPTYRAQIKHRLAENALVRTQLRGQLRLPPEQRTWAEEWSQDLVSTLDDSGVDVVGDLRDLLPARSAEAQPYSPDMVTDEDIFEVAAPAIVDSVTGLVGKVATTSIERRAASPSLRTRIASRVRRLGGAGGNQPRGERTAEEQPLGHPPKVFVHVGLPKTGTTHLQAIMSANRNALRGDGFMYPVGRFGGHFLAALDVMDRRFRGHRYPGAEGTWRAMTQQLLAFGRAGLISHEVMFAATEQDILRIARSLAGAEVHVVITARDLGRQLPAVWQEQIKLGHTYQWEGFIEAVKSTRNDPIIEAPPKDAGAERPAKAASKRTKELSDDRRLQRVSAQFWRGRDCSAVARRWATVLPPERIHIVTVPSAGADQKVLWQRFASVLGLDPDRYDLPARGANTSLGPAETEVMRRLNPELRGALEWEQYERHAKWDLGERVLASRQQSGRMALPSRHGRWVLARSKRIVADLRDGGYAIAGQLEDLLPAKSRRSAEIRDPDQTDDSEIAATAVDALIGLARLHSKRSHPPPPNPPEDVSTGLRGHVQRASVVRFPGRARLGRARRAAASWLKNGRSGA